MKTNPFRRIVVLVTLAALALSCTGCGKKGNTEEENTSAAPTADATASPTATPTPTPEPTAEVSVSVLEVLKSFGCSHENTTYKVIAEPTCTAQGAYQYVCSDCDEIVSTGAIEATGHHLTYANDQNTHWQVCSDCGYKAAAQAHTFNADHVCAVCGYGCTHQFTDTVTAPACLKEGYTTHTCTLCGYTARDSFTSATGHSYVPSVQTAAKCITDGVMLHTCSHCGDTFTTVIPAPGHTTVVDAAVEANCQHAGKTEGAHCSVCGATLLPQEEIPATDHLYLNGECIYCGGVDETWEKKNPYELPEILG